MEEEEKKKSGGTAQWVKVIFRINKVNLLACVSVSMPRINGRRKKAE